MIVAAYLFAVVAANLSVAIWGPSVTVINAFLFIGLDLTARDRLHEAWSGRHLWARMLLLIATGGAISYVLNRDTAQIAIASTVAFIAAGIVDAVAYTLLGSRSKRFRVNGSNVLSAAVDSVVFPTLAFGALLPAIVLGQFIAKIAGGAVWYEVLRALPVGKRQAGIASHVDA